MTVRTGVGTTVAISSNGGLTYSTVARVLAIDGPAITAEPVEVSTLDSVDGVKEFVAGLRDGGDLRLAVYWLKGETTHRALRDAVNNDSPLRFRIAWPTTPASYSTFDGQVAESAFTTGPNEGVQAALAVKITGAVDWNAPTTGGGMLTNLLRAGTVREHTAGSEAWNAGESSTTWAAVTGTADAASPYSSLGDSTWWQVGFPPDGELNLARNTWVEAATLYLDVGSVGASWAGAEVYGRKADQAITPSGAAGPRAMTLTTAKVTLTTGNTSAGTNAIDVTEIMRELLLTAEWDATDHAVLFVVKPLGTNAGNDPAKQITWRRAPYGVWSPTLELSTVETAQDWEAPLTNASSTVICFLPVSAADCAEDHQYRVVCPTDLIGGRASFTLRAEDTNPNPAGDSPAPDPPLYTTPPVTYDGAAMTAHFAGWYELEAARFAWDEATETYNGQRYMFGTAFHLNPAWAFLNYSDGWLLDFKNKDSAWMVAANWGEAEGFRWIWDTWNKDPFPQLNAYIQGAVTGDDAIGRLLFDCDPNKGPINTTRDGIALIPGGRIRIALIWRHATKTWHLAWWQEDTNGDVYASSEEELTEFGPATDNLNGNTYNRLTGWGLVGVFYGWAIMEFGEEVAYDDLLTMIDHQTRMWTHGVKSLDPRIMVE